MMESRKKVVILGWLSTNPVPGVAWLAVQYMMGFERLGYAAYYVEQHDSTANQLMRTAEDDAASIAAAYIGRVMRRFGFEQRWAYQPTGEDDRCFGMSAGELDRLFRSAELVVNLHGATFPRPEHSYNGRLIFLETDPVALEIYLDRNDQETIDFLEPHVAFFTWAGNFGEPDCKLPVSPRFTFLPTRPIVVADVWQPFHSGAAEAFTTVGNWRQNSEPLTFRGKTYRWSKHLEFLKFLDLPEHTSQPFELALGKCLPAERRLLREHGWRVRGHLGLRTSMGSYARYIGSSRGEFTVAKEQNIRLRTGWFSERSATYLASGRPVITQETGFSNQLPTGEGLFGFSTMGEILRAVDMINGDYDLHCSSAFEIAREYFNFDVVLPPILEHLGLPHSSRRVRCGTLPTISRSFPADVLLPFDASTRDDVILNGHDPMGASRLQSTLPSYDIVCLLPCIRGQWNRRLLHLDALADQGHRVFFLRGEPAAEQLGPAGYRVCAPERNVFMIDVPDDCLARPGNPFSLEGMGRLLDILSAVRREYGIIAGVTYSQSPRQARAAQESRERWSWRTIYGLTVAEDALTPGSSSDYPEPQMAADAIMAWPGGSGPAKQTPASRRRSPRDLHHWRARWDAVSLSVCRSFPRVTVVLIAGSSLVRTKLCLESLLLNTEYPHYDVTVLIAGRANRTWEYMRHISRLYPHVRAQPASEAADVPWRDGSYLAVLDAGTIVHPGWLSRLVHHLERTGAGIATPESDELHDLEGARALRPYGELQVLALDRARANTDQPIEIADASLHCGVVRRQVCEQLGLPFRCYPGGVEGIRDYAVRAREAGYVLVRAPDVLVHRLSPPAGGEATSRNDMQARREGVGAAAPVSAREVQGHQ